MPILTPVDFSLRSTRILFDLIWLRDESRLLRKRIGHMALSGASKGTIQSGDIIRLRLIYESVTGRTQKDCKVYGNRVLFGGTLLNLSGAAASWPAMASLLRHFLNGTASPTRAR